MSAIVPFELNMCQCCAILALHGDTCRCEGDTDIHPRAPLSLLSGRPLTFADDTVAIGWYECEGCNGVNDRWTLKATIA